MPPSTRSKRTSSTRQQHSHSPQPPPLSRSLADRGRGGLVGPWSSTVASTQASRTRTATSTGSPPPDPYKMALVAASSKASSSSSATWVGSSHSASRAARRRPASSNGEAEIVSSTPDPLPEAASFRMVHPRIFPVPSRANPGTPTATDGRYPPAVSSPARPLCLGEHPWPPDPGSEGAAAGDPRPRRPTDPSFLGCPGAGRPSPWLGQHPRRRPASAPTDAPARHSARRGGDTSVAPHP